MIRVCDDCECSCSKDRPVGWDEGDWWTGFWCAVAVAVVVAVVVGLFWFLL